MQTIPKHLIHREDIVYIQAYGDYLKIITKDSNWVTKDTMKSITKQLPTSEFLRIHKSYICNISAIMYLEGNQVKVGNAMLPIGATYKEDVWGVFNSS